MKKNSIRQSPKRQAIRKDDRITIGLDLGDRSGRYCVLKHKAPWRVRMEAGRFGGLRQHGDNPGK